MSVVVPNYIMRIYGAISRYINSMPDLEAFQLMSMDSYSAAINLVSDHTHIKYPTVKDIICYNHVLEVRRPTIMVFLVADPRVVLVYMVNDMTVFRDIPTEIREKVTKVHVIDNVHVPVSVLIIPHLRLYPRLREIRFANMPVCQKIDEGFLYGLTNLVQLDLSGLLWVRVIGDGFLAFCTAIVKFSLNVMPLVQEIGSSFMSDTTSLTEFESQLSRLVSIGSHFLLNSSIKGLLMRRSTKLETIGDYFANCFQLRAVGLYDMSNVTTIGSFFLANCFRLKMVSMTEFTNLQFIGQYFIASVHTRYTDPEKAPKSSLEHLTMHNLTKLEYIDDYFLRGASVLRFFDISGCTSLREIGNHAMFGCNSIVDIDLFTATALQKIGNFFATRCDRLRSIKLPPTKNKRIIIRFGNNFPIQLIT